MHFRLHPKQGRALRTPATELLYGGAAGGGKSHLMRAIAIAMAVAVPGLQIYLVRREYGDLKANHFEGRAGLLELLREWISQGIVTYNITEMLLRFPNGSRIEGAHFHRESDALGWQGREIDVLLIDELTHFTEPMYRAIRSRVRSAGLKVPEDCPWTFPRIIASSNPGGPGHNWVKAAFIDPVEPGEVWQTPDDEGGMLRQYIPAKLKDNPTLSEDEYQKKLKGLKNPALVKAMLEGSWDIVAGGMFDDVWLPGVVREPCAIPRGWRRSRSFDWGSSKPFSVCWWAQADGTAAPDGWCPPKGTWVLTGEWYGWNGKPNEGCRMLAVEVARGILEREREMGISGQVEPGPADSAIFATENGQCIADDMARLGVRWERADKGPGSRINGWERMRALLRATHQGEEPGLVIFASCRQACRTLPTLPRDPKKQDDVDTDAEDHIGDAVRYRVLAETRRAGGVVIP